MSTPSDREAALRRALLSAAEQIEPAPGGLERIHAKLRRPRPALIAWIEAAWAALVMRAPDATEAIRRRAANVLRLVWERFGPKSAPGPGPHRLSWVRPLSAMTVAVFVLGAGVYVALQSVSSTISPTNGVGTSILPGSDSHSAGAPSGGGTTDGHATKPPHSSAPSSGRSSSTCRPSATPYNPGHASTAPPLQSPTSTAAPSQSTTTSPSPSPSTTGGSTPPSSTPPASGGSGTTPDTGGASENPASAGGSASANATLSAALSAGATGKSQKTPCQTQKSKNKHHKNATVASTTAQLAGTKPAQTQPGRAVTVT